MLRSRPRYDRIRQSWTPRLFHGRQEDGGRLRHDRRRHDLRWQILCELTPLDLALGVFPLGNLALAIYFAAHTPAARVGPDILATATALDFRPHGVFNPADSFFDFSRAWADARAADISYDVTNVYVKVVQALGRASEEVLRIRPEDAPRADFPDNWGLFASDTMVELASRRRRLGNGLTYSVVELRRLRNDIVACGNAWTNHQSVLTSTAELQTFGSSVHRISMVATQPTGAATAPAATPAVPATPPPPAPASPAITAAAMRGIVADLVQATAPAGPAITAADLRGMFIDLVQAIKTAVLPAMVPPVAPTAQPPAVSPTKPPARVNTRAAAGTAVLIA